MSFFRPPVHNDLDGRGGFGDGGVDQEALAVPGNIVGAFGDRLIEECPRNTSPKRRRIGLHRNRHDTSFERKVEQLLPIRPSPPGLPPAARRDELASPGPQEGPDVDFRPTGFIGRVDEPTSVGREAAIRFGGCRLYQSYRLPISFER